MKVTRTLRLLALPVLVVIAGGALAGCPSKTEEPDASASPTTTTSAASPSAAAPTGGGGYASSGARPPAQAQEYAKKGGYSGVNMGGR